MLPEVYSVVSCVKFLIFSLVGESINALAALVLRRKRTLSGNVSLRCCRRPRRRGIIKRDNDIITQIRYRRWRHEENNVLKEVVVNLINIACHFSKLINMYRVALQRTLRYSLRKICNTHRSHVTHVMHTRVYKTTAFSPGQKIGDNESRRERQATPARLSSSLNNGPAKGKIATYET